jgi:hypothetical protein
MAAGIAAWRGVTEFLWPCDFAGLFDNGPQVRYNPCVVEPEQEPYCGSCRDLGLP